MRVLCLHVHKYYVGMRVNCYTYTDTFCKYQSTVLMFIERKGKRCGTVVTHTPKRQTMHM